MTSTISKYFSGKGGGKRKPSSTSSLSDTCTSPESDNTKVRQENKKQRQDSETSIDTTMALQDTLKEIKETLVTLATKEDIKKLRDDMERLTTALTVRIEKLESNVFELENEKDKMNAEMKKLRGENTELRGELEHHKRESNLLRRGQNDHEQHSRQWNLRVYGVPEVQGEESVEDCVNKCVEVFSKRVGAPVTTKDLEIAHRSGKKGDTGRPRPILVRFFSRSQRGLVLAARRKLKQSGVSIGEDLTQPNYRLLRKVSAHSATMAAWSTNGKILVKLKNGKTARVDINTDIDAVFSREMR